MARVLNTRQMIEVMQAYLDGKKIEYCYNNSLNTTNEKWYLKANPVWSWATNTYRIKQEPREYSVVIDREGNPVGVGHSTPGTVIAVKSGKLLGANVIKVRESLNK